MARQHIFTFTIAALAAWFGVCAPATASAQDALSRAKDLYASAAYEDALQLLDTVKDKATNTEAGAYQVFCLVALGRRDDAKAATEALVRTDPLFRPSEAVSPRIRAFFDDVRKPLLPELARQAYAKGKTAFDQKAWAQALAAFDRALALLQEVDAAEPSVADVRTLAAGFRDLHAPRSSRRPPSRHRRQRLRRPRNRSSTALTTWMSGRPWPCRSRCPFGVPLLPKRA